METKMSWRMAPGAASSCAEKEFISDIWQKRGLDIWQKWGVRENLGELVAEECREGAPRVGGVGDREERTERGLRVVRRRHT